MSQRSKAHSSYLILSSCEQALPFSSMPEEGTRGWRSEVSFPPAPLQSLWSGPGWQKVTPWHLLHLMNSHTAWLIETHGVWCSIQSVPCTQLPVSSTPLGCPGQNPGRSFSILPEMASSLTTTTVSILFRFNISLGEKGVLIVRVTACSHVNPFPVDLGGRTLCAPKITVSLLSPPLYIQPFAASTEAVYRKHPLRLFRAKCLPLWS